MLCTDLTLPVMTVVWYLILSGMALTLGFPAEIIHENRLLLSVRNHDSQLAEAYPLCPLCGSFNPRLKSKTLRYLDPIIIKMENVLGKYEEKKVELENFYARFNELTLLNKKELRSFGCLNSKQLKRKVSELTKEIRKVNKNLGSLINLENSWHLRKHNSQEGRLELLKEFRAEIKNLIEELRDYKKRKNKRRSKSLTRQMPKKIALANLSRIKSQTELKIEEWKMLTTLKTILENEIRNFKHFYECLQKKFWECRRVARAK